jgi:hypothetical protein
MELKINNETFSVNRIIYISTKGDDSNDGTFDNPLLSYHKAIELAADNGDAICFLPGNHVLYLSEYIGSESLYFRYTNKYCDYLDKTTNYYAMMSDKGKSIIIYGYDTNTTISFENHSFGSRWYMLGAISLQNSSSKIIKINFELNFDKVYSYIYYDNFDYTQTYKHYIYLSSLNITTHSKGKIYNCFFTNKSDKDIGLNTHAQGIEYRNCSFDFNGNILDSKCFYEKNNYYYYFYNEGISYYNNCIFIGHDFNKYTKRFGHDLKYYNLKNYGYFNYCFYQPSKTDFDKIFNKSLIDKNILNCGDSSIQNPDKTRSHIGIFGGPFAWVNLIRSLIVNYNKEENNICINSIVTNNLDEMDVYIYTNPINIESIIIDYEFKNNLDTSNFKLLNSYTNLNLKQNDIVLSLKDEGIPEGLSLLMIKVNKQGVNQFNCFPLLKINDHIFVARYIVAFKDMNFKNQVKQVFVQANDVSTVPNIKGLNLYNYYATHDMCKTFTKDISNNYIELPEFTNNVKVICTSNSFSPPENTGCYII